MVDMGKCPGGEPFFQRTKERFPPRSPPSKESPWPCSGARAWRKRGRLKWCGGVISMGSGQDMRRRGCWGAESSFIGSGDAVRTRPLVGSRSKASLRIHSTTPCRKNVPAPREPTAERVRRTQYLTGILGRRRWSQSFWWRQCAPYAPGALGERLTPMPASPATVR